METTASIAVLVGTVPYGMLVGWAAHWAMHRRWSGPLYRVHLRHHALYSPSDMEGDGYRDAGDQDSTFVFVPAVGAAVALLLAAAFLLGAPWWVHAGAVAQSAAVGWANDVVHESFHVRGHWLRRFGWAGRLADLHRVHHRDVRKNLGIFWLLPDKLFGTYEDR